MKFFLLPNIYTPLRDHLHCITLAMPFSFIAISREGLFSRPISHRSLHSLLSTIIPPFFPSLWLTDLIFHNMVSQTICKRLVQSHHFHILSALPVTTPSLPFCCAAFEHSSPFLVKKYHHHHHHHHRSNRIRFKLLFSLLLPSYNYGTSRLNPLPSFRSFSSS